MAPCRAGSQILRKQKGQLMGGGFFWHTKTPQKPKQMNRKEVDPFKDTSWISWMVQCVNELHSRASRLLRGRGRPKRRTHVSMPFLDGNSILFVALKETKKQEKTSLGAVRKKKTHQY